jgi:cell division protein FtsB
MIHMNVALKEYPKVDFATGAEQNRVVAGSWLKVLATVAFSAVLMTVVAVASVWLKLEIEKRYQRIDAFKVKNTELARENQKLEAELMRLQSYDKIQQDLTAAGVTMSAPREIFYFDPNRAVGVTALSGNDKKGSI